ncbi:hypothetical protein M438DRAFT_85610 [Aureobasidium pullulans EXF-150]|uniref:Transmembrane protein n=1 Tax=Aureobasidium pullulans EXF-150 TaxID=1043002 RepID=A0A074XSB7_AURPU|nr:uncharacterized protein M438DRAFT_85610 [Aureobasidium pullulans EXF-150]KEQ88498.1 hypothetical protein M438DRAFT_85610 [Aureobasidium pullulans EXF-150]
MVSRHANRQQPRPRSPLRSGYRRVHRSSRSPRSMFDGDICTKRVTKSHCFILHFCRISGFVLLAIVLSFFGGQQGMTCDIIQPSCGAPESCFRRIDMQ